MKKDLVPSAGHPAGEHVVPIAPTLPSTRNRDVGFAGGLREKEGIIEEAGNCRRSKRDVHSAKPSLAGCAEQPLH